MSERLAIYFAPSAESPLWTRAASWLGRDPLGAAVEPGLPAGVSREALDARTISARRYGFHATIKAPFRLGFGHDRRDLERALEGFAARMAPVAIGPLKLALIDGFLALIPGAQSEALTGFAAEVVTAFDSFRAPPTREERERRMSSGKLTARQVELMEQWGYPYVLEQFQLHMTLTDRLAEAERPFWFEAAATHFGPLANADTLLDRLVLFHEAEPGAPFTRLGDYPLTGAETAR